MVDNRKASTRRFNTQHNLICQNILFSAFLNRYLNNFWFLFIENEIIIGYVLLTTIALVIMK